MNEKKRETRPEEKKESDVKRCPFGFEKLGEYAESPGPCRKEECALWVRVGLRDEARKIRSGCAFVFLGTAAALSAFSGINVEYVTVGEGGSE